MEYVAVALDAFSRLVGAIVCATLALTFWNLTARSPLRLARDVITSFTLPRRLIAGCLRFLVGLVFATLALSFVLSALHTSTTLFFSFFAVITFVTALAVESLIGEDIRRIAGI